MTTDQARLEGKLLALGGKRVFCPEEPHLDLLLERGQVFKPKGRKRLNLELHLCHRHAALHYAWHHALHYGGTCEIVTGYGLDHDDGTWRPHSWLWDGRRVIEPNIDPCLYFGVILTPPEACKFTVSEVITKLPGWPAVASWAARERDTPQPNQPAS
jgi:hypothetical protein